MFRIKSKTEKSLLVLTGVLFLVLAVSIFSKEPSGVNAVASESSDGSEESTSSISEDSDNSEQSEESENSDTSSESSSSSEVSEDSEESEDSEKRTFWNKIFRTSFEKEVSEESMESSESSQSEISEDSVQSEESVKSEELQIVATEGYKSIVKRDGKLFFLIPVKIESRVTLDETGNIINEKKSFPNWLLSMFSF